MTRGQLETDADTATVLLLNDKHHPGWKVTIDGEPAQLLRANYLMRGCIYLRKHVVEFRFAPPEECVRKPFGTGTGIDCVRFGGCRASGGGRGGDCGGNSARGTGGR